MKHETAGDPINGRKWSRKTTASIAAELLKLGIDVSDRTTSRLLKLTGFSLRVNHKKISRVCKIPPKERDAQFVRIAEIREDFMDKGLPVISVDTKKKELIGQFKNPGATWTRESIPVNDHDFRSDAKGIAVPYGIYDLAANQGTIFVGASHDTPEFAAESIERWWRLEGMWRYEGVQHIAIPADAGGSNGPTCRAWKLALHRQLCEQHGLTVTVAHYPSGASKWNPIEHRLFSEISKNWAGRPLDSYQTMLNYIRGTRTATGLSLQAHLVRKRYDKGVQIPETLMSRLPVVNDLKLPRWNYTLTPS